MYKVTLIGSKLEIKMEIRTLPIYSLVLLLMFFFMATKIPTSMALESITGRRQTCSNEGEEVKTDVIIRDFRCFKCICQNGFVACEKQSCPSLDDCYVLEKKSPGVCCQKCKGCIYKGVTYASGVEWTDPEDPCMSFQCVAGVVTKTTIQCYTPCRNPLLPRSGQCCPTCLGCYLNGQIVKDGREVTLTEDPCLKCQCSNKILTCMKKSCPILQCPISKQIKAPGECCARCTERREIMQIPGKCILGKGFYSDGKPFSPDQCSTCTCTNGTSICHRNTCPVLECAPEYQRRYPDECCPHCPPTSIADEVRSTCTYQMKTYQNDETWNLDSCRSCKCHNGEIRCAQTKCPKVKCRPNETLVTPQGQCCAQCIESAGVCTIFGDPHYKTFDGKFFSFQGSCKYQLAADCRDHTFSIRVTNDARKTKLSSWIKSITLKLNGIRVNLGQRLRVKVNGTRVSLPYDYDDILHIERITEGVLLKTNLGLQIEWDGNHFIQLQVPITYKNHLCGLCGNYNGIARDDLTSRDGTNHNDEDVWRFANSWKVGGIKACSRKHENLAKRPNCKFRRNIALLCKPLSDTELSNSIFGDCDSRLNPDNYFEACKIDMCECPSGGCYCDSFSAYAHECKRLGVKLPNWRDLAGCIYNGFASSSSSSSLSPSILTQQNKEQLSNHHHHHHPHHHSSKLHNNLPPFLVNQQKNDHNFHHHTNSNGHRIISDAINVDNIDENFGKKDKNQEDDINLLDPDIQRLYRKHHLAQRARKKQQRQRPSSFSSFSSSSSTDILKSSSSSATTIKTPSTSLISSEATSESLLPLPKSLGLQPLPLLN